MNIELEGTLGYWQIWRSTYRIGTETLNDLVNDKTLIVLGSIKTSAPSSAKSTQQVIIDWGTLILMWNIFGVITIFTKERKLVHT